MKTTLSIYIIISFLIIIGCQSKTSSNNNEGVVLKCTLKEAENEILSLLEVKEKEKLINDISEGKHGLSLILDSIDIEGKLFYQIQVGYNSPIRFENYYTFYVEKGNCDSIKILDVIDGVIKSLDSWREKNKLNIFERDSL